MEKAENRNWWKKLKRWQKGVIIGGVVGLITSPLALAGFEIKWIREHFHMPLLDLNTFFTGCRRDCVHMYLVYPIVYIILCILVGVLLSLTINKIKYLIKNKNAKYKTLKN